MAGNSTPPWNPMAPTPNSIGQMLPSGFTSAGGGPSTNYADPNANRGSMQANWDQPTSDAMTLGPAGHTGVAAPTAGAGNTTAAPAAPAPSGIGVEGSALQSAIASMLNQSSGSSAPAATPAPAQNQNYGMGTQLNNSPTETNPDNGEQFVNQYTTLGDG